MTSPNPSRNYWIDCLRGYAILLVCISHLFHVAPIASAAPHLMELRLGSMGVHIFYFISGFLVVRILSDELSPAATGPRRWHGLRNFWLRRVWRLQPSLIAFVLIYLLIAHEPSDHLPIWALILPVSNLYNGPYYTWHLKTLHLEEAFYVISGLFLFSFSRFRNLIFISAIILCVTMRLANPVLADFKLALPDGVMSYATAFEPMLWGGSWGSTVSEL